jgi:hypothetical protein
MIERVCNDHQLKRKRLAILAHFQHTEVVTPPLKPGHYHDRLRPLFLITYPQQSNPFAGEYHIISYDLDDASEVKMLALGWGLRRNTKLSAIGSGEVEKTGLLDDIWLRGGP